MEDLESLPEGSPHWYEISVYDVESGRKLSSREGSVPLKWGKSPVRKPHVLQDGRYLSCEAREPSGSVLVIRESGRDRALAEIRSSRSSGYPEERLLNFDIAPDGERLVFIEAGRRARFCRRRHPEWWWGVFWLWEFWLTAAFAGVFVWSVWRDRRTLKVAADE